MNSLVPPMWGSVSRKEETHSTRMGDVDGVILHQSGGAKIIKYFESIYDLSMGNGKSYQKPIPICPLYRGEGSHRICCKGPPECTQLCIAFANPGDLKKYKARYCHTANHARCIIVQGHGG